MTVEDSRLRAQLRARGLTAELRPARNPAVLVVDFVRAFTDPELPFGSDLDGPSRTRKLLDAAPPTSPRADVWLTTSDEIADWYLENYFDAALESIGGLAESGT